jgi:hypothetical protein
MFHTATPRRARSSAIQFMIFRSAISVCQQPPWTMIAVGCGPLPAGSQRSTTWSGSAP